MGPRRIPEDSEFGCLPLAPSLLPHHRIPECSLWHLWRGKKASHQILSKWEGSTDIQGFIHLAQQMEAEPRQERNQKEWWPFALWDSQVWVWGPCMFPEYLGTFFSFSFFFFLNTNEEVCQCLSRQAPSPRWVLLTEPASWSPCPSLAIGVRL